MTVVSTAPPSTWLIRRVISSCRPDTRHVRKLASAARAARNSVHQMSGRSGGVVSMVPVTATTGSVTSSISSARQTCPRRASAQVADWNQAGLGMPSITEAASAPTQDCGWITDDGRESTRTHVPRWVR